jgi:hypothetical protein
MSITIPSSLTDDELVVAIGRLRGDEREVTARLVAHLAEMEGRQLYVPMGYDSLFIYCHEGLGYSEDAAYNRKTAALVARRYPASIGLLADGRLSLTAVRLLAPVLKEDNWQAAFAEAAGKPKREVEKLVARLEPKPDVPSTIRRLPQPGQPPAASPLPMPAVPERREGQGPAIGGLGLGGLGLGGLGPGGLGLGGLGPRALVPEASVLDAQPSQAPAPGTKRSEVKPLAPARYRVGFTIGEERRRSCAGCSSC